MGAYESNDRAKGLSQVQEPLLEQASQKEESGADTTDRPVTIRRLALSLFVSSCCCGGCWLDTAVIATYKKLRR